MLTIRIFWVGFFGVTALAALSEGLFVAAALSIAAAALGLPQTWRLLAAKGAKLANGQKIACSLAIGLLALFVAGTGFQNTPEGRAQAVEAKRVAKAKAKITAEADEAADAKKTEEKRKGFHCLSGWDGSYRPLVGAVKENARNPSSFEHIATVISPVDRDGAHQIIMKYRAENGFGGMSVETITATADNKTCVMLKYTTE